MNFFRFFRRDPTVDWPDYQTRQLRFTVADMSLDDVRLGNLYDKLSKFGKPDNRTPYLSRRFHYLRLGVLVELDDERIDYFAFIFQDELDEGYSSCSLTLLLDDGTTFSLSPASTSAAVESALGKPVETDTDEDETVCFYRFEGKELEFELTPAGKLKRLNCFYTETKRPA